MTARPDEVVAWQLRYRFWDGAPWGQWHGYPTEAMRNAEADMFSAGNWLTESRDLTDVAALQSANARLAELESEFGAFRQMAEGIVHRWIHDPKYSLDQCTNELLKLLDSGRAAAGEGDGND